MLTNFRSVALAAVVLALGACTSTPDPRPEANVVFLHWNDFHGQFRAQYPTWKLSGGGPRGERSPVGGAASMATFVARAREAAGSRGQQVVVTDGGDWFQGTLEGNETRGRLVTDIFARLGVDVAVLGNHEYDFGPEVVRELATTAKFPVLAANIAVAGSEPRRSVDYVRPFQVLDVQGVRVAIVGLIAHDTKDVSTGPWGEAEFEDEAMALAAVLPAVRDVSDAIVLLTHCGFEVDRELARRFPEVALILGGHSHTGLPKPYREGSVWIVQTHGRASEVYRVEARADRVTGTLELLYGELIELDHDRYPPDGGTEAWLAAATTDISATWDRRIGTLETDLTDRNKSRSTAAGNLVCDALAEAAGAQLAFANKGGLRTALLAGPLTPRMIYELLPFENELISMNLTGAQVRAILQAALGDGALEIGGGAYHYRVQDGERVLTTVAVGGEPLVDGAVYRVATSSFLARGGSGLAGFLDGTEVRGHGVLLRDVLIGKAEREGRLAADTTNRIVFEE